MEQASRNNFEKRVDIPSHLLRLFSSYLFLRCLLVAFCQMTCAAPSVTDTPFVCTTADLEDLSLQAKAAGEVPTFAHHLGSEHHLPRQLGQGGDTLIELRGGLTLQLRQAYLHQSLCLEQTHTDNFPLVAKFYLAGGSQVRTLNPIGIDPLYDEQAGCNYLYYLPDLVEIEEWPGAQPQKILMMHAPLTYFQGLIPDWDTPNLPANLPLKQLFQGQSLPRFHHCLGQTTLAMQQILTQIWQAPYQGGLQQLYLESKVLELFTMQFAQACALPTTTAATKLTAADCESLHQARQILVERVNDPLSLIGLARLVGLNDRKLKQGFRQLFGMSVFGYLRDYRLQQAQVLLTNPNLNVTDVAHCIGYASLPSFSKAFRQKFGYSPQMLRRSSA
jgi:AraC family transcriptional regulator, transcriptional activator of the genes for pyochelin and ferripyochelin receptors